MKNIILVSSLFISLWSLGQNVVPIPQKFTSGNKGKFYVYWGGNRGYFSKSDIRFRGADYDFTLKDVKSHDKPKGWHIDYINPFRLTIPQTNARIGYFITDNYNISLGLDHMKYVMYQHETVDYTGNYPNRGDFNENTSDDRIYLTEEFLTFEHTDGLNYINVEFSRYDDISRFIGITDTDVVQLNFTAGVGLGLLYPKTNTALMGKKRHDDFHLSGYGLSAKLGLNFTFFKYFFIQTEMKGGYIDMGSVRTTSSSVDKASHSFTFLENVIALGGIFKI